MGTRANDLDFNPGGTVAIDGDTDITKFGFDYSTTEDLFATLIRIRNTNCEGFAPCSFTLPPFDTNTAATYRIASGSSLVPSIGQLTVHDDSVVGYRSGTIASNLIEQFDDGVIILFHDFTAGLPSLDGAPVFGGPQMTTRNKGHVVDFTNIDTAEEQTLQIVIHGPIPAGGLVILDNPD